MENNLDDMIKIIDAMPDRMQPTKMDCNQLNNMRKSIDGVYDENCFCTRTARRSFLSSLLNWINLQK